MGSEKSIIRTLILTQLIFLGSGCGDASNSASLAAKFPGYVPTVLPGAEIISQEVFNDYLRSGRLAPYKSNVSQAARRNGSSLKLASEQEFVAAASLGDDMILVRDYVASHRGSQRLKNPFSDPEAVIEVVDVTGGIKRFQLSDNSYRIVSVANAIRRQQSPEIIKQDSAKNVSQNLHRLWQKSLLKRGLASDLTPLPSIRCPDSEVGHGTSSDEGSVNGGLKPVYRVFSDGLISNFDWPLKNTISCIKNQGIRGSCTAFSIIGAMEILISQKYNLAANLSEQALYFKGKGFLDFYNPGSDGFSAQLYLEDFEKNENYRVVYEKGWNYNLSSGRKSESDFTNSCGSDYKEFCSNSPGQGRLYCTRPTTGPIQCGYLSQLESTAVGARIAAFNLFLDLGNPAESLRKAIDYLKQGIPIVVETTLTKTFYAPYHGYVSEPSANDRTVGGHSALAVGYISEAELLETLPARAVTGNGGFFIIKNSWAPSIGDAGYFYVSFNYLVKYAYSLFAIQDVNFAQY